MVIDRAIAPFLRSRLAAMPAVALLGPRQVGKTTLARRIGESGQRPWEYLDLESPSDRRRLDDPEAYLRSKHDQLVVLDEIHRMPELLVCLRGLIDERRRSGERTGHFLLLGSASLDLVQSSETLAGRVADVNLDGIGADEAASAGFGTEGAWVRGGFPDSLLTTSDRDSYRWRLDLIKSYLERDITLFAPGIPAETLRRLWTMLAHHTGGLLNSQQLAAGLSVSNPTVTRYLDLLVDLQLVRRLPPWTPNVGKRLVRSPRVYVRDSGIVHALLGLDSLDSVLGHPVAGMSWESYVIETLCGAVSPETAPYFYRTSNGAEIDLVLVSGGRPHTAVEIKRSPAQAVSRGFHTACDEMNISNRYVVSTTKDRFPVKNGVEAIGVVELARQLRSDW